MRKVFIDGGAHCGCSRKKFAQLYGADYEIFSFEPDPAFNKFCPDLINQALWKEDTTLQYYKWNLTGASSVIKKRADLITHRKPDCVLDVQAIDIDKFIRSLGCKVTLKLDVEGAEYEIIPHMLERGTFELVDLFYIEWHNKRVGVDKSVDEQLTKEIERLGIKIDLWDAMKSGHCIGANN